MNPKTSLARRLKFKLSSPHKKADQIAGICAVWIKNIGLPYKVDVMPVHSVGRKVFMVWVHMPGQGAFNSLEVRALRLFLTDKVHDYFGIPARSYRLVLHMNIEANGPPSEVSRDLEWMRDRFRVHAAPSGFGALQSAPRSVAAPVAKAAPATTKAEVPVGAKPYGAFDLKDDVAGLHVAEASMTDFARMA